MEKSCGPTGQAYYIPCSHLRYAEVADESDDDVMVMLVLIVMVILLAWCDGDGLQ